MPDPQSPANQSSSDMSAQSWAADDYTDLDFSPPASLNLPLWRSLLLNLMDRFSPDKLPPLRLTSRPVDVVLRVCDLVSLPWYRTVFSNIVDVVAPETLPPLQSAADRQVTQVPSVV